MDKYSRIRIKQEKSDNLDSNFEKGINKILKKVKKSEIKGETK